MKKKITYKNGVKFIEIIYEGNEKIVSDDIKRERTQICSLCPSKNNDMCDECNCILKVLISYTTTKCPMEKW